MRFIAFRDSDNRLVPLVVFLAVTLLVLGYIFDVAYASYVVDGTSMVETLHDGDHLLVTEKYTVPRRGDIVSVNVVIEGAPDVILKRVAAIPGDTVEVQGDSVYVNGELATWPGVITGDLDRFHLGPFSLTDGELYLLGDNRPESLDSRFIGPVDISQVNGRAVAIYLPVSRIRMID